MKRDPEPIKTDSELINDQLAFEGSEDEEDLHFERLRKFEDVVIHTTDWTVGTIIGQILNGNIELAPFFQRREAWNIKFKSQYIESLLLNFPVPPIVLAQKKSTKQFVIIDGKQRLLTLLQFGAPIEEISKFKLQKLQLCGLTIRTDLENKTYEKLENEGNTAEISNFENQTVRTIVIKSWPDEDYLYTLFYRINNNSTKLSPQELRNALKNGDFVEWINKTASESAPLQSLFNCTVDKPDFRMRDVELAIRHIAFKQYSKQYKGNLKDFLDSTCDDLNRNWDAAEQYIRLEFTNLETAICICTELFYPERPFRRWNKDKYEGPFNRAVFDILAHYYSIPEIAARLHNNPQKVLSAFRQLCDTDEKFRDSLVTTTKSLSAVKERFHKWAEKVGEITETKVDYSSLIPKISIHK